MQPQDYSARVAYRPPRRWYARLNRLIGVPLARLGWTPSDVASLEVRGRSTGRVRATPVVVARHEGARYLVSLAGEAQWVRNVRADDGRAVLRRRTPARVILDEVPVAERAPILAAYLRQAARRGGEGAASGQARSYFGLEGEPTLSDFAAIADRYPVFRVRRPS